MASDCTCGRRFLDGEDYRDHLPCSGPQRPNYFVSAELYAAARDEAKRAESDLEALRSALVELAAVVEDHKYDDDFLDGRFATIAASIRALLNPARLDEAGSDES